MPDLEQKPDLNVAQRRVWRNTTWAFGVGVVGLVSSVGLMLGTDQGSQFLLNRVLASQSMVSYQYVEGNLYQGIIIKNLHVNLKSVDIKADHADLHLGWRAILEKQIHLSDAEVKNLQIITKNKSNGEPFKFPKISLPFVLRVDALTLDQLLIQTATGTQVKFHQVKLKDTLWKDTHLKFAHTYGLMGQSAAAHYLAIKDANGWINFDQKYPLSVVGKVNLPSLKHLQMQDIAVVGKGSLDTIQAGVATHHPDLVSGWAIVHPMRNHVPMHGAVRLKNYHWPFVKQPELYTQAGQIGFSGDVGGFNLNLNTDLEGKQIPKGQYQAKMFTDFVHGLDIHQLSGQVLEGDLELAGRLDWSKGFRWDVKGQTQAIQAQSAHVPQTVQDFLPQDLTAKLASTGEFSPALKLSAEMEFANAERWHVQLQPKSASTQNDQPLHLDVRWANIDRRMPYIGWLKSQQGQLKLDLLKQQQHIQFSTEVQHDAQSQLPQGRYQATVQIKDQLLSIPTFQYQAGMSQLQGQAQVHLPTPKQSLRWTAQLQANAFNLQQALPQAPINNLQGQIKASGYAKTNQQIVQIEQVDLKGMAVQYQSELHLRGRGTVAALFHDAKQGGGFKSFALNYDGRLDDQHTAALNGQLKLRVSGTPDLIRIDDFQHRGAAGRASAQGAVYLKDQLAWQGKVALIGFKTGLFFGRPDDELSGYIDTRGQWDERQKLVQLNNLNLRGRVNGESLRSIGQLNLNFNAKRNQLLPLNFSAKQLRMAYAGNRVQAHGTEKDLKLLIDAPYLNKLHPELKGRIVGQVALQSGQHLRAHADVNVHDFAFSDQLAVRRMHIQGDLPTSEHTPTQLSAVLLGLRSGQTQIQQANALLKGTYAKHQLQLNVSNPNSSQFKMSLLGGLNAQKDWTGTLTQGELQLRRMTLKQMHVIPLKFSWQQQRLSIGKHCWQSVIKAQVGGRVCLNQDAEISAKQGQVSLISQNVQLSDFAPFMPEGLNLTGQLNGHVKAQWQQGKKPSLDAQLATTDGLVGLSSEDINDVGSTLAYKKFMLSAKTVAQGLQLNLDVYAQGGSGYAKVLVDPWSAQKNIVGDVAFDKIQMKIFKPFIADARSLGGELSFAGQVRGRLTQPQVTGKMRLSNGSISMLSIPVNLHNIQLSSDIQQNQASIQGGFNSGQGAAKVEGAVNWAQKLNLKLRLTGKELYIRQAPLISALVSPEVNLNVTPSERNINLSGNVDVLRAIISMPQSSANVVNTSADVRVIRNNQIKILNTTKAWKINSDIQVNIGLDKNSKRLPKSLIIFKGFNTQIPFLGRLNLTQQGREWAMRANGAIGVSESKKIEAYGQSLDLKRAIARFNGPLADPNLDVDVNKNVQGNLVGFSVTGTGSRPNIRIYNDAGLSEQEALNALITGRINEGVGAISQTEGFKSDVNNTIAAAGISLGLGGTRALTNQIGRTFGLSGLAFDAEGTGDDTQVNVTGYITPDLYIRYGVGVFTPVNKLTLRYQMNKRTYLEASQSLERAIDVFYSWKF